MSMLMPFSANTIRVRWLHGSFGAEKSVMMDRLLGRIFRSGAAALAFAASSPSVHVFPVFVLEQPGEPREDEQEQHDPNAEGAARNLRRFTCVVEEVHRIADEGLVFRRCQAAGRECFELN